MSYTWPMDLTFPSIITVSPSSILVWTPVDEEWKGPRKVAVQTNICMSRENALDSISRVIPTA